MQCSPSPLFTTSSGWQLPPNTPSPPPPYRSPFATHLTTAAALLEPIMGMRLQSNPLQSQRSSKQGKKWGEKKFGNATVPLGVGLGVEVEREMHDTEMERVLELADGQSKALLKKRLEEMKIHIERQVRGELLVLFSCFTGAHHCFSGELSAYNTIRECSSRCSPEYPTIREGESHTGGYYEGSRGKNHCGIPARYQSF